MNSDYGFIVAGKTQEQELKEIRETLSEFADWRKKGLEVKQLNQNIQNLKEYMTSPTLEMKISMMRKKASKKV